MTNIVGNSEDPKVSAIKGEHKRNGIGIEGLSKEGIAVSAISEHGTWALYAFSTDKTALFAHSGFGIAIDAQCDGNNGVAINAVGVRGTGVYATGQKYAGDFKGIVRVTGDIQLENADCAEDFEVLGVERVEPGTVMSLNDNGKLEQGRQPYDKRVAGVISGADDLKPGLILGRKEGCTNKLPIALVGKVNCKVDASYGPVEVGDLLTTSATPGHAMKASDPMRAFGAVIGKALKPLKDGCGLIPILVALQ